jgi:hypothetical protein
MEVPCEDRLPAVLDPDSASALCQCQPGTIEDALRSGLLPGLKLGTGWIIPSRAFMDRLNQLAVIEAERRMDRKPAAAQAKAAIDKAAGRRAPPQLPSLEGA